VACEFLRRGIPLLVEKPLAATVAEADQLLELANRHGALLQVGHIERFNPAFEQLCRRPIQPKFVTCERLGPFTGRSTDIGVVLDLMIHDLDLILALVGAPVKSVEAVGVSVFGGHEDVANARLHFANGCVADVAASRASAVPSRRMHVWAPEGYARVDFRQRRLLLAQPSEQVRRRGLEPTPMGRPGDPFGGQVELLELDCNQGDQLSRELEEFVTCVRTGVRPRAGGAEGRDALGLAERILKSLRSHHWDGGSEGPTGPLQIPAALGRLFQPGREEAAA
jgi:predicted dehydrogenase